MKILFVHNFYQNFGGEDACALAEKALLESRGQNLVLYTRDNKDLRRYSLLEKLAAPLEAVDSARTRREVAEVVHRERPDVAYVHNFFPLVSPSLYETLYRLGVPCVHVAHDFRFLCANALLYTKGAICEACARGDFFSAVRNRCYRNSYAASIIAASAIASARRNSVFDLISTFICPTEFSRQKLFEAGVSEHKLVIKPHFIDASMIVPRFGGSYVLYLGRLAPEKGIETLVRAMASNPKIPLKVVGSGPLEESLGAYIREKGLKHIEFLGFKSGSEKWRLLRDSAFVVVPSECYETFGLAALEAYAVGKCVIASRLGALPYVVEQGRSGLLFTAGDANELSETVRRLWSATEEIERMGRYARELVETKYGPDENFQVLRAILTDAVTRQWFERRTA